MSEKIGSVIFDSIGCINSRLDLMTSTFGSDAINSSLPPQRIATDSTNPLQHQYEVTERNDVGLSEHQTIQLPETTRQPLDLDIMRLYSIINNNNNPHQAFSQSNELFAVNPNTGSTNVQFGQSNVPMQTNLHSSLHVGFPSTAIQTPYTITQQIPADFQTGHPVSAPETPMSATQFYDLLNKFPPKFTEQYTSGEN